MHIFTPMSMSIMPPAISAPFFRKHPKAFPIYKPDIEKMKVVTPITMADCSIST